MYSYGSNRAIAAIMASTILAILMISSIAPIVQGHDPFAGSVPSVEPSSYPIFCDTTGTLRFWVEASAWYGVAIEIPKDGPNRPGFKGVDASKVTTSITNRYGQPIAASASVTSIGIGIGSGSVGEGAGRGGYIWVWEEYPSSYYWVEIDRGDLTTAGLSFTGTHWIEITGITAPSVAGKYACGIYYINTDPATSGYWFPATSTVPYRFANRTASGVGGSSMGTRLGSVVVPVAMREETSTISGMSMTMTMAQAQP